MDLEQFRPRVALEHGVDQIRGSDLDRLANAEVARFAAVHQVDVQQVDLLDAHVEVAHVRDQPVDLRRAQADEAVGHQRVALGAQPVRLGERLQALGLQRRAPLLHAEEFRLELLVLPLQLLGFAGAVGERQLDFDHAGADLLDVLPEGLLLAFVVRDLDQVALGVDLAAQDLEGAAGRGHARHHSPADLAVDLRDARANRLFGRAELAVQLLVFRRLADLILLGRLLRLQFHQEARVVGAETGLVLLVGPHDLDFVVDRPHQRGQQQQHRHE